MYADDNNPDYRVRSKRQKKKGKKEKGTRKKRVWVKQEAWDRKKGLVKLEPTERKVKVEPSLDLSEHAVDCIEDCKNVFSTTVPLNLKEEHSRRSKRKVKIEPCMYVSDEEAKDPTYEVTPNRTKTRMHKIKWLKISIPVKKEECETQASSSTSHWLPCLPSTSRIKTEPELEVTVERSCQSSQKFETAPTTTTQNKPQAKKKVPRALACILRFG